METILQVLVGYVDLVSSWWWLLIAFATFIYITVIVLRDDDPNLSIKTAVRLSFVGLGCIVPLVRNKIPPKPKFDFKSRWVVLGLNTFLSYTFVFSLLSLGLGPLFSIFVLGTRALDYYERTEFAYLVGQHGIKKAIKMKFQPL